MTKYLMLIVSLALLSLSAFAQVEVPGEGIFEAILKFLSSAMGQSAVVAMILEFVLRLVKSEKPLSILYIIAAVVKKIGDIFVKLGQLLDKVLPQKLK